MLEQTPKKRRADRAKLRSRRFVGQWLGEPTPLFGTRRLSPTLGISLFLTLSACVATADVDAPVLETGPTAVNSGGLDAPSVARRPVAIASRYRDLKDLLGLRESLPVASSIETLSGAIYPGEMSIVDAARLSVTSGMDVQIAAARADSRLAAARTARLSLGPQLTLQGELSQDLSNSESTAGNLERTGNITLNLSRPLLNLPRQQEVERRFNDASNAELEVQNAHSFAILAAVDAYMAVLQSQLIIAFAEEYEQRLEALATIMEQRVAAGGSSAAELERVTARIQGIRATISDVRAGLSTSLAELVVLTGQRPEAIRLPLDVNFSIPRTAEDAMVVATAQNGEIKTANGAVRTSAMRLREVELRRNPTVDATLSQEIGTDWTEGRTSADNMSVGINLNWTLYRSGMLREELAEAKADIAEAEARRTKALQTLHGNLQRSYVVLGAVNEQREAYQKQVQSNEAVVAAFTEQIRSTNRPVLDFLEAYQNLFQSKIDLTNLLVTETQINLKLLHLLGELSIERLQGTL